LNNESVVKGNPYLDVPGFPQTGRINLKDLVSGEGEVELEIGFGKSHFLLGRAANNLSSTIMGIETRRKWVHRSIELAQKRELSNAIARHGDAREVLFRLDPNACLSRIFINFPDPWWKACHQKRMVITSTLLSEVVRLLKPGGDLFVQTDVDFRADAYHEIISKVPELEPFSDDGKVAGNPFNATSSRERRCEELGLPIYRLHFRRK